MRKVARWAWRTAIIAGAITATWLGGERRASAEGTLNVGADLGFAARTDTKLGFGAGAHIEVQPIPGLLIGPYFFHGSAHLKDDPTPSKTTVSDNAIGGRVRYQLAVTPRIKPFLGAGVGYTFVEFPALSTAPTGVVNPASSHDLGLLQVRSGKFVEVPLGGGIAFEPLPRVQLSLSGYWRPAFSFSGTAYDDDSPFKKAFGGFSATVGLAAIFWARALASRSLMRPRRRSLLLAAALASLPADALASDPAPYQFELGPSLALASRVASPASDNIRYNAAFAPGLLVRITLAPWLRVGGRYTRALHNTTLSAGALQTDSTSLTPSDATHVTTLDGYLYPTWNATSALHVYGVIGLGWGSVLTPAVRVDTDTGPTLRLRQGVFLESPFGLGAAYDVLPGWLSVSFETLYAPAFSSSGDSFSTDTYLDRRGQLAPVGPYPTFSRTFYQYLTLSLTL
jgi:opacity protein-like surface antigen